MSQSNEAQALELESTANTPHRSDGHGDGDVHVSDIGMYNVCMSTQL